MKFFLGSIWLNDRLLSLYPVFMSILEPRGKDVT